MIRLLLRLVKLAVVIVLLAVGFALYEGFRHNTPTTSSSGVTTTSAASVSASLLQSATAIASQVAQTLPKSLTAAERSSITRGVTSTIAKDLSQAGSSLSGAQLAKDVANVEAAITREIDNLARSGPSTTTTIP